MENIKKSGKKVCESCGHTLSSEEVKEGKVFCQECENHWNND